MNVLAAVYRRGGRLSSIKNRKLTFYEKYVLTKRIWHIIKYLEFDGGIAQSVERRNHNPCVVGSNPSPATI